MERKHLLIITRSDTARGGADRIVRDLCDHLPAYGWRVTLGLVIGDRFNRGEEYAGAERHVPTVRIGCGLGYRPDRIRSIRRAVRKTKPDVVLSMRIVDAAFAVSTLKKRDSNLRFAMGIRSYEPEYLTDLGQLNGITDLVVTSGELIASACREECGVPANRVVSIPGGIELPAHARPRCVSNPLRLVYAGRLESTQKRAREIVDFVRHLKARKVDFTLNIAGSGEEEAYLRFALRDSPEVKFDGWLDPTNLYSLFRRSDVLIHFAGWEGVTIAPREAMAYGVIPVISRFIGINRERQFIHGKNALIFPVGHPHVAAAHVERIANSRTLAWHLSKNAVSSQVGKYTQSGAIAEWNESLRRCCSSEARLSQVIPPAERFDGRLAWLPERVSRGIRRVLNRRARHGDPGSEWPTSTGTVTEPDRKRFAEFAARQENREC